MAYIYLKHAVVPLHSIGFPAWLEFPRSAYESRALVRLFCSGITLAYLPDCAPVFRRMRVIIHQDCDFVNTVYIVNLLPNVINLLRKGWYLHSSAYFLPLISFVIGFTTGESPGRLSAAPAKPFLLRAL